MKNEWNEHIACHLPGEIYITDNDGLICYINRSDKTIFGIAPSLLIGRKFTELPFTMKGYEHNDSAVLLPFLISNSPQNILLASEDKTEAIRCNLDIKDIIISEKDTKHYQITVTRQTARDEDVNKAITTIKFLEKLDKVNVILNRTDTYHDLKEMNDHVLQALLEIFSADRAWLLYPCDPNAKTWRVPAQSAVPEYPGVFEVDKELPVTEDNIFVFNNALNSPEPTIYDKNNISPESYEMASMFSIKSAICIALYPSKGKPWLLGLHQCATERIWSREERDMFMLVAERYAYSLNAFLLLDEINKSESQYRVLTETAQEIILSYTPAGSITYLNNRGIEFFGTGEDYHGLNIFDYIPTEELELIKSRINTRMMGMQPSGLIEMHLTNCKNELIPFEISSSAINTEDKITGIISVMRDITERKRTEHQLLRQNTELQIINEELDRFVYSASHELRGPLSSMLGLVELLKTQENSPDEKTTYLSMVEHSIQKLDVVIRSIVDYSRNNRLTIKNEILDIEEIYLSALDDVSYMNTDVAVEKKTEINNTIPFASDDVRIKTMLNILLSNAVKYRKSKITPLVSFSFSATPLFGTFIVEDNGEGIPLNKQARVFDMFYRYSNTSEGAGLGLYIAKQIINKLDGSIDLHSEEGKGSRFTVKIPNMAGML
jgi:PAS domain S-box-containing protein